MNEEVAQFEWRTDLCEENIFKPLHKKFFISQGVTTFQKSIFYPRADISQSMTFFNFFNSLSANPTK